MLFYYTFTEFSGCGFQGGKIPIPEGVPFLISRSVLGDAIPAEVGICSSNRQPTTIQVLEVNFFDQPHYFTSFMCSYPWCYLPRNTTAQTWLRL